MQLLIYHFTTGTGSTKEQTDLCWTLDKPVMIVFCRELHTCSATKTTVQSVVSCYQANHGESCASYMRREELTTQNLAHKATCLLDKAQSGCLNLNCDGTTLSRKLQGAAH